MAAGTPHCHSLKQGIARQEKKKEYSSGWFKRPIALGPVQLYHLLFLQPLGKSFNFSEPPHLL